MILQLFGINWATFHNSIFLPLFIGISGLVYYRLYRSSMAVTLLTSTKYAEQFVSNFSAVRSQWKVVLSFLSFLFLLLALLSPQWNEREVIVAQEGTDLFIALDVSRSMLAQDARPNRLECAKDKIRQLVHQLSCERVGLILFSGSTFVQCPLTRDYSAFHMFLDQIDVETISSGTTAVDQAIQKSLQAFEDAGERKTKLLLLVTDGEDFSRNLTGIKQKAHDAGMSICALGVGSKEGAPIPLFDERGNRSGHQKDSQGNVVISRLNASLLHEVVQETGGTYVETTQDHSDIGALVAYVGRCEKDSIEDKKLSRLEEQYPFFLLVSFICCALEWLL